ncbi:PqqD family protein [Alkalihalobacillus sp. CinArs1]|uniref:PqqD family protein n=1 Tax=Alkalihalobacillus sp. CinArs1 TaxID=2995314 RepID=UPI0022DD6BDE|nr:PqqD family protein [Alkalihalobacillus sp. CinArs1]
MNSESSIKLTDYQIHKNQNEYIVENVRSAEYYEMNESAVEAIKLLDEGKDLDEIERILLNKFPQDDIDVRGFTEQLVELGFILGDNNSKRIPVPKPSVVDRISPKIARFFFNTISYTIYLLLFLVNITLLVMHPEFIPHYSDLFISDSLAVSMLTYLLLSLVLIFFHEMGHVLAVRSHNLSTNLSIGHRLFLIVIETDMTHAWRLKKKERNQLYLSGICFDNVLFLCAILTQMFFQNSMLQAISSLVLLDIFIKFVYQCCVYMKTDFYYVIENSTGYYNLMERSREWVLGKNIDVTTSREKITLWLYGVIYIIGVGLSILLFIFYMIPQLYYMLRTSLEHLSHPIQTMYFWDGFVILLQLVIGVGLLLFTWSRSLLNKQ